MLLSTLFGGLLFVAAVWWVIETLRPSRSSIKAYIQFISGVKRPGDKALHKKYQGWALVTGSTSGIGTQYAHTLAKEGFPLILTGRNMDALKRLSESLSVECRTIQCDLSNEKDVEKLIGEVKRIIEPTQSRLSMAILCAGLGVQSAFSKMEMSEATNMINVNVTALTQLALGLTPMLQNPAKASPKTSRSALVLVSSLSAYTPTLPYQQVYAATKAYVSSLGRSLAIEYTGSHISPSSVNVDVLSVEPGPVETEFQNRSGQIAHDGMLPQEVVEVTLNALYLGITGSTTVTFDDALRYFACRFMPWNIVSFITTRRGVKYTPMSRQANH